MELDTVCCDMFKFYLLGSKNKGLNIRIVKSSPIKIGDYFIGEVINVYVTEGYSGEFGTSNFKKFKIDYCPFCGSNLDKIKKEQNVNENW